MTKTDGAKKCDKEVKSSSPNLVAELPEDPFEWFASMERNCLEYAENAWASGRPIVGIMCEYTPREIIMASGAVPVCICGGTHEMVQAAEKDLPPSLCPLIKSTYGAHLEKTNPFMEKASLIVAESTCDGKKKMFELMDDKRQLHTLELPRKSDDLDAFEHWYGEVRKLVDVLEKNFNVIISGRELRTAIENMNRERSYRHALSGFMKTDTPPLTGRQLLNFRSKIACMPLNFEYYDKAAAKLRAMPPFSGAGERVRVLLTGAPLPHGAERVLDIIEDNGGLVVAMENCTGLKPLQTTIDVDSPDLLRTIAEHYFHNIPCAAMTNNQRRLDLLSNINDDFQPQCVIEVAWHSCLTYNIESHFVQRTVEDELKLPYLKIETDYSSSDSTKIVKQIKKLFKTIK